MNLLRMTSNNFWTDILGYKHVCCRLKDFLLSADNLN